MPQSSIECYTNDSEGIKGLLSWVFDNIHGYISGKIFEMSTDSFSISPFITLKCPGIISWHRQNSSSMNLADSNFETIYKTHVDSYNTVIALNALSDGFYKKREVNNLQTFLKRRGNLIAIFPANTTIFPGVDLETEFLKRENSGLLQQAFKSSKVLITRIFYLKDWNCFPSSQKNLAALAVLQKGVS